MEKKMGKRKQNFHKKLKRDRWKNIPVAENVSQEHWDSIFNKNNKKEEDNKMRKTITIAVICILLSGCGGFTLPRLTTPRKPETVYNWSERVNIKPKAVITNGKTVIVEETEKELIVNYQRAERKVTFIERLGGWISNLSLIGFILLIVGFILAPSTTIGFLFNTLSKWRRAMKETVSAIKESQVVNENEKVENCLRAKQSKETKKIVGNIKAEL